MAGNLTHPDVLSVYRCSENNCSEKMIASSNCACPECGSEMNERQNYTNYVAVEDVEEILEQLEKAKKGNSHENGKTLYTKLKYAITQTERALSDQREVVQH